MPYKMLILMLISLFFRKKHLIEMVLFAHWSCWKTLIEGCKFYLLDWIFFRVIKWCFWIKNEFIKVLGMLLNENKLKISFLRSQNLDLAFVVRNFISVWHIVCADGQCVIWLNFFFKNLIHLFFSWRERGRKRENVECMCVAWTFFFWNTHTSWLFRISSAWLFLLVFFNWIFN